LPNEGQKEVTKSRRCGSDEETVMRRGPLVHSWQEEA